MYAAFFAPKKSSACKAKLLPICDLWWRVSKLHAENANGGGGQQRFPSVLGGEGERAHLKSILFCLPAGTISCTRCNVSGSIRFKKLILKGDYQTAMDVAKQQVSLPLERSASPSSQRWFVVSLRNSFCGVAEGLTRVYFARYFLRQ